MEQFDEDGTTVRLEDTKTGPRTLWLGPEAARLLAALPRLEGRERVFPENLTSARLYTFWVGIREEAGLPGLRIHDTRHTWASQGVMNGIGLTTVGRLLGHWHGETTAIYAHLDDGALQDAAAQAAAVIARAMGYRAMSPSMPEEMDNAPTDAGGGDAQDSGDAERSSTVDRSILAADPFARPTTANRPDRLDRAARQDKTEEPPRSFGINWL